MKHLFLLLGLLPAMAGIAWAGSGSTRERQHTPAPENANILQLADSRQGGHGGYFGHSRSGGKHLYTPRHQPRDDRYNRHQRRYDSYRHSYRHDERGYGYYNRYYGYPGSSYGGTICWSDRSVSICFNNFGYGGRRW
ncbi:hypothetical protein C2E25_00135 [Geothermobacter hydrogeniphilus]|uniref:Uncharacterized protein n=1 Tax=Geothermobacter hydrogeniphilus TaxID=1969733 RepID=A0A2K2HEG4_9BACT|nr:hypothetical protein [Geothermobacter hydrogeniphilus]PNU21676.1 hypothetical protein C2E25_00135 [Geothermobacter hydrogeniphilus]